jgi:hypothetical protein
VTARTRTYLVESYSPGIKEADVESAARRAAAASEKLSDEGRAIVYGGAILVPEDEVVFHLFSSGSEEIVREASARAAVSFERVVESVALNRKGERAAARAAGDGSSRTSDR